MEYKGLENLQNTYPGDTTTVSDSYSSINGSIKYSGIYPQNFIKFGILSLDDILVDAINVDPEHNFRFIIKFINEDNTFEEWTSQSFLNDLHQAQLENDPFFTRDRVTVAEINSTQLINYWKLCKFKQGEDYAEVIVESTIKSKEEILKHINWIVSPVDLEEGLRPVNTIGNWSLHTKEWNLGFREDIRDAIPDLGPPLLDDICDDESSDENTLSTG